MPLNLVYRKLPPSCVLALPADQRKDGQECACEGKPHAEDWVKHKPKLSYGEKLDLATMMGASASQGLCWMIARLVAEWSLLDTSSRLVNPIEDAKGEPLPIEERVIYDLDEETADFLTELLDDRKPATGDGDGPKARGKPSARP